MWKKRTWAVTTCVMIDESSVWHVAPKAVAVFQISMVSGATPTGTIAEKSIWQPASVACRMRGMIIWVVSACMFRGGVGQLYVPGHRARSPAACPVSSLTVSARLRISGRRRRHRSARERGRGSSATVGSQHAEHSRPRRTFLTLSSSVSSFLSNALRTGFFGRGATGGGGGGVATFFTIGFAFANE